MYGTGLMPPRLALLRVIGGPLIFVSPIAGLLGADGQAGADVLFTVPEAAFEASLAIYLIAKGSSRRGSSPEVSRWSRQPRRARFELL